VFFTKALLVLCAEDCKWWQAAFCRSMKNVAEAVEIEDNLPCAICADELQKHRIPDANAAS
jgi:hypothetical protein